MPCQSTPERATGRILPTIRTSSTRTTPSTGDPARASSPRRSGRAGRRRGPPFLPCSRVGAACRQAESSTAEAGDGTCRADSGSMGNSATHPRGRVRHIVALKPPVFAYPPAPPREQDLCVTRGRTGRAAAVHRFFLLSTEHPIRSAVPPVSRTLDRHGRSSPPGLRLPPGGDGRPRVGPGMPAGRRSASLPPIEAIGTPP